MNVLLNYASPGYEALQRASSRTAIALGGVDRVAECSPADLDPTFRRHNAAILEQPRGAGLWKPCLVRRARARMGADDSLFYADADLVLIRSVVPLAVAMWRAGRGIAVSAQGDQREDGWTKRDCFVLTGCDAPRYAHSRQIRASWFAWRRTPLTLELADGWLRCVQDERPITVAPNRCGLPNHPAFRNHRHDQGLFSLLCKKRGART